MGLKKQKLTFSCDDVKIEGGAGGALWVVADKSDPEHVLETIGVAAALEYFGRKSIEEAMEGKGWL